MTTLRFVAAQPDDLPRYLNLLEEAAVWLEARGITQWPAGQFQLSSGYYAASIARAEVHLVFAHEDLAGTLRLLPEDPVVWPEIDVEDAFYVYNLALAPGWVRRGLGRRLLTWAEVRTASLRRQYVRLDAMADNQVLRRYYNEAGYVERGEVDAPYPAPIGTLRLRRFEKRVGVSATI
jgi:ribosomal protein S18 acetylase RimI-like enzyme